MKLRIYVLALIMSLVLPALVFAGATDPIFTQWRINQQEQTFDHIEKISTVLVGATAVVTPTDSVSTNTASVYYLPDTVVYPIKLTVQNHGTASLSTGIYSTTVAAGVYVPNGDDETLVDDNGDVCVSDKKATFIFYQAPNRSFSSTSTASATFTVESITAY